MSQPRPSLAGIDLQLSIAAADCPADALRVAVKDCIDIQGYPTRCGSAAFAGAPPATAHAAAVQRLLDAGCRITGKTLMHELAYGMTGVNPHGGTPVNPRWPDRIPGGSSSGSAVAVAAGVVDFSIGTDTGGSVRQPAICCGVIGFKPTFGRIDRRGAHPAASSLDCIGPFARSMATLERAMQALDPGFVPQTLTSAPRLARLRTDFDRSVGDSLILPIMDQGYDMPYVILPLLDDAFRAGMIVIGYETAQAFGHLVTSGAPLGNDIRARLTAAMAIPDAELAWAETIRHSFTAQVDALLDQYDAFLTPALPSVPPLLTEASDPAKVLPLTRYLRPFNLSGHPAIVLPTLTSDGLPAGLQIVGRRGADALLCAIARWFCDTVPSFQAPDLQDPRNFVTKE
ncbi:MAG: amidase [Paracoccaceae bacterium]